MMIEKRIIAESIWSQKCPYKMKPKYLTIHNFNSAASAEQEVAFLLKKTDKISYHVAVDENKAIQIIPFDRNAWHCGDGEKGKGNRSSIGVEICRGNEWRTNKHKLAFDNAIIVVAQIMNEQKIPIDNLVQHNYWSGEDCPKRIRHDGTWDEFVSAVNEILIKKVEVEINGD